MASAKITPWWSMPRKFIVRIGGDVREHPRYSIEEAAAYLRIPETTLAAWVRGKKWHDSKSGRLRHFIAVIDIADKRKNLLSFYNLAEAHVLRATRDRRVPLHNVRRALEFIREAMPSKHPLLTHDFETSGKELFVEHLGQTVNATQHGQIAMREVLEKYLKRINRDDLGMPIEIHPMDTQFLAINPMLSSGKPVVKGTGIMASILTARNDAGESIPELASDYGLPPYQIEQAIKEYAHA
jgi:uncharacterized protein (DUF433 family)